MKTIEEIINKVHCADSFKFLKEIPENCIDLIVTDPPYNIHLQKNYYSNRKRKNYSEYVDGPVKHSEWLPEIYRILKNNTHFYCFSGYTEIADLIKESEKSGFENKGIIVWHKEWTGWIAGAYGYKYKPMSELCCFFFKGKRKINSPETADILKAKRVRNINHPCPKPTDLLGTFIKNSTNENDLVLDPFSGSGSTVVACKLLKRNFIGIEINPKYVGIAEDRLKQDILL